MSQARESRSKSEISFTVNGLVSTVRAYPMERLLDVLRGELGLTGTKDAVSYTHLPSRHPAGSCTG